MVLRPGWSMLRVSAWHARGTKVVLWAATGHPSGSGFLEVMGSEEPSGARRRVGCTHVAGSVEPLGESLLPALLPVAMAAAPSGVVSPCLGHHCGASMPDTWGVSS
jgi:hypothetical protein